MEEINAILAKSIEKVRAMDNSSKKKMSKPQNKVACTSFPSTASIVYQYLQTQTSNPKIAKLFLNLHPEIDKNPSVSFEEVVSYWKTTKNEKEGKCSKENVNGKKEEVKSYKTKLQVRGCKRKAYKIHTKVPFKPKEDAIILAKIEEMGSEVGKCNTELAKELGRNCGSVAKRIKILKSGDVRRRHKAFSVMEDEAILDNVLPDLKKKNLKDIVFTDRRSQELASALGRSSSVSVSNRWVSTLQPWILQYEAGTLNFDIRQMLANHVSENYVDRESIRWDVVAKRPEFAGHTEISLRTLFTGNVINPVRLHNSVTNAADLSLKQISDGFNMYIVERKPRVVTEKVQERQMKVIEYYKKFVKKYDG